MAPWAETGTQGEPGAHLRIPAAQLMTCELIAQGTLAFLGGLTGAPLTAQGSLEFWGD